MTFPEFFQTTTHNTPYVWQQLLAGQSFVSNKTRSTHEHHHPL